MGPYTYTHFTYTKHDMSFLQFESTLEYFSLVLKFFGEEVHHKPKDQKWNESWYSL